MSKEYKRKYKVCLNIHIKVPIKMQLKNYTEKNYEILFFIYQIVKNPKMDTVSW